MIIYIKTLFGIKLTKKEKEIQIKQVTDKYEKYKELRRILIKDLNNG